MRGGTFAMSQAQLTQIYNRCARHAHELLAQANMRQPRGQQLQLNKTSASQPHTAHSTQKQSEAVHTQPPDKDSNTQ